MSSRIGRIPSTRSLYARALILVSLPLSLTTCSHVFGQKPVSAELTGHWQLFVDDYLIESKGGVVRTYHPLIKHPGNPVLGMEGSWGEERTTPYGTVLPGEDGRTYRIWYDIWDGECHNFYATSQDGLHWVRPSLGLVDHQGSRDNNPPKSDRGPMSGAWLAPSTLLLQHRPLGSWPFLIQKPKGALIESGQEFEEAAGSWFHSRDS